LGEIRDMSALLEEYREVAVAWDAAQTDYKVANPLFVRLHKLAKRLRATDEGRSGLSALMADECRGVRLCAAAESLSWDADLAVAVLEALESPRGRHSLSAEYTLKEHRAGRLNMDW
jgi:hypothetical protein